MFQHWQENPDNPNQIWDANFQTWIPKPGNYDQIMRTASTTGAGGNNNGYAFNVQRAGETGAQSAARATAQGLTLSQITNPKEGVDTEAMIAQTAKDYPRAVAQPTVLQTGTAPQQPSQAAPSASYGGNGGGLDTLSGLLAPVGGPPLSPPGGGGNPPPGSGGNDAPANGLQVRMPDGSTKTFPAATPDLAAALQAGGQAINPQTGQPMKVENYAGGLLFDGQPFNKVIGGGYQPGQENALFAQQNPGKIIVQGKDGKLQAYDINGDLDAAFKNGGIPIDPMTGKAMKLIPNVNGGYLAQPEGSPYGLPLNVIAGGQLSEEQKQGLATYYGPGGAGYSSANSGGTTGGSGNPGNGSNAPGSGNYPVSNVLNGPTGDSDMDQFLNSPLNKAFPYDFSFGASDLYSDPSYQTRFNEGQRALEHSGSAKGTTLSGAQFKALERYGQDFASNEYAKAYSRKFGEFQTSYDIFRNTQNDRYNRLNNAVNTGLNATNGTAADGNNLATNGTNTIVGNGQKQGDSVVDQGNANASGVVGNSNARQQGYPDIVDGVIKLSSIYQR